MQFWYKQKEIWKWSFEVNPVDTYFLHWESQQLSDEEMDVFDQFLTHSFGEQVSNE